MVIEHYISELLYRYNCVIIPEFGAFLTQRKSASINQSTNSFIPPTKTISFNNQLLANDGLLVSHIAQAEGTDYEAMLSIISAKVAEWKTALNSGERLNLEQIGDFVINSDKKLQFIPLDKTNYLTSSFGLSSFVATPITREVLKEEVEVLEEKIPFIITPERRENKGFRPYLKYAAIFLLATATGLTGYRSFNEIRLNNQLAQQEAQEQVKRTIQEATFFDASPLELPALNLKVKSFAKSFTKAEATEKTHFIIAGAFRYKTNADKKIQELQGIGFNASYIGTNPHGLHMVSYESYTNSNEAIVALKKIKKTQSKEAWLKTVN